MAAHEQSMILNYIHASLTATPSLLNELAEEQSALSSEKGMNYNLNVLF